MDYASNSHKSKDPKPEKEKIEKVISEEAIVKEKSIGKKFKNIFFGGDFKQTIRFVAADILLPGLRNMVADASKGAVDRVIYGESSSRARRPEMRGRTQYHNPLARHDPRDRGYLPNQPPHARPGSRESNDIILASRADADLVLERLIDILDKYEVVSLADLNELIGVETRHTDQKWGWFYLSGASVRQVRDGYMIDLPPLEPI